MPRICRNACSIMAGGNIGDSALIESKVIVTWTCPPEGAPTC